jgi:hypothetical protein
LLFSFSTKIGAAPPIMELITIVEPDAEYYFQSGNFMILNNKASIAMYPLQSILPTKPPTDLSKWTKIDKKCNSTLEFTQSEHRIVLTPQKIGFVIKAYKKEQLRAETTWLTSTTVCSIILQDVDLISGPEVILLHKQTDQMFGITIFRLPENAYY